MLSRDVAQISLFCLSVCRAIGIPCRCMTSYASSRISNTRLSVDFNYSFNEKGDGVLQDSCDFLLYRTRYYSNHQRLHLYHFAGRMWNSIASVPDHCIFIRPNHCGRHLGKINGHNSTYVKVWRCTFGRITRVLMGKSWGHLLLSKLRCLSGLPSRKNSGNCRFNSIKDRPTCHRSLFQAYKFAMHFRTSRCDVTDYGSV